MYDDLQTLENPALREFLKLDKSVEGMVVHRPDKTDAAYPLKEWDVITRIGDTPIDNQGMVKIDKDLRVNFAYMIQRVAKDGKLPLTVVRAGKTLQIELPVSANHPTLAPDLHGDYPSYFVYGPMVFSTATLAVSGSVRKQRRLAAGLGLREKSAGHADLRCAECGSGRTGHHLLAVLSAQIGEWLFECHRLGGVFDQRHAREEPEALGRAAARS